MRVSTLAACALTALAGQNCDQQAIAAPQPVPPADAEPTALPREESESIQAIATPEAFRTESSTSGNASLVNASSANSSTEQSAEPFTKPSNEAFTEPLNELLTEPFAEPILNAQSYDKLNQPAQWLTSQRSADQRSEIERAIEIPVEVPVPIPFGQMPVTEQSSELMAQTPTTSRSSSTKVKIDGQDLPVAGVLPLNFTFPIQTRIISNSAIASNTPITDQEFPNPLPRGDIGSLEELARYREARTIAMNVWAEQIRDCMAEYPNLVSIRQDGTEIPVLFNGRRGKIVRNANGRLVCPVV